MLIASELGSTFEVGKEESILTGICRVGLEAENRDTGKFLHVRKVTTDTASTRTLVAVINTKYAFIYV